MIIPLWRRFAIALAAIALAAVLFRGQLGAALIVRGDDAMRSGDQSGGIRYYHRALRIDARSATAADRLAFLLAMRHTPADARASIDIATTALRANANDAALLADRALAEQFLHRWPAAQDDFSRAADVAHDARFDHFAGRVALVRGRPVEARYYFRLALARDAHFDPARVALEKLR